MQSAILAQPARSAGGRLDWHLVALAVMLLAVLATRAHSYLLFHSLAELFWIVVALTTFAITWNTRRHLDNPFLLLVGLSLGPAAMVDVLHVLAFKGMGVFTGYDANLPTQLWIVFRTVGVGSILAAAILGERRIPALVAVSVVSGVAALLVALVFFGLFPDCFVTGRGLTPFKVSAEYAIMGAYAVSMVRLRALRHMFPPRLYRLMLAVLATGIVEEATFTLYTDVFGILNMTGHLLAIVYAYLIYAGVIRFGLALPQEALYHRLNQLNARLADEALRNNERAALAVEAVGGAAWEWDMASPHAWLSPRHHQWLGRPATLAEWRANIQDDGRAAFDGVIEPRPPGEARTAEYRLRRPDGTICTFQTTTRVFPAAHGTVMIGLDQDVSAAKAAAMERQRLANDVRRFAEILAHHLQEPARLQAIYAQLLRRSLPLPLSAEVDEALDVVTSGAEHLRRLLRDAHLFLVLDRLPQPVQPAETGEAVAVAWARLKDRVAATGAALTSATLPSVWVDEARLVDLFQILLSNALEYRHSERAPQVVIGCDDVDGEYVLRIADNGLGIEPAYHERVFIPFERLHTQAAHPGTGIGLAVARKIVETAGGRIWLTSNPGEGTTVFVALPKGGYR